jgi:hypothetical protein
MTADGGLKNLKYSGSLRQCSARRRNETWLYSNLPTPTRRPARKTAKFWWIDFSIGDKRVCESAKTTKKTIAGEEEKRRRQDLERTYAGLPSEAHRGACTAWEMKMRWLST